MLGGVFDPDRLVLRHVFLLDRQPLGPEGDLGRIGDLGDVSDLVAHDIFPGSAGAAVNESEITLPYSCQGDPQGLLRTVWHIVLGIIGRLVVLPGINPEYRKVSGMARPHPVVGVSAEFADGGRRCSHEPHIPVDLIYEEEILVPVIQRFYPGAEAFACR